MLLCLSGSLANKKQAIFCFYPQDCSMYEAEYIKEKLNIIVFNVMKLKSFYKFITYFK